jgi:hypothetical protein
MQAIRSPFLIGRDLKFKCVMVWVGRRADAIRTALNARAPQRGKWAGVAISAPSALLAMHTRNYCQLCKRIRAKDKIFMYRVFYYGKAPYARIAINSGLS